MLRDDAANGIDDLASPAVADREVDVQARVAGRPLLRRPQNAGEIRQHLRPTHVLHPPAGLERQLVGELGDDLDEIGELLRVALGEVVGGQQVSDTTRMPRSSHQRRNSCIFAAPARCPCATVVKPA
jgi:hypothetical protein